MRALITVATVVIIIIIFTSVYCIKSSFNISYTEKIKSYAHLITLRQNKLKKVFIMKVLF